MMPRIRTVKPELFKHEDLFDAETKSKLPLRLAFIALFSRCDREGRFRWKPRRLKIELFPYDELDMNEILNALEQTGFIKKYQYQGECYGCIPSWSRHQRINQREAQSELPEINDTILIVTEKTADPISQDNHSNILDDKQEQIFSRSASFSDFYPIEDRGLDNEKAADLISKQTFLEVEEFLESNAEQREVHSNKACRDKNSQENHEKHRKENNIQIISKKVLIEKGDINQIFEHWKKVMNHPKACLDPKRKALIGKALNFGYKLEELCEAINGCSVTPYNMGDNDRNQRYDGLHIILRDSDQIDRFIFNHQNPPRPITEAGRRTEANVSTLQGWINQKMAEEASYANT